MNPPSVRLYCEACRRGIEPEDALLAEHPWQPSQTLCGCPSCREPVTAGACDVAGCDRPVSVGYPTLDGYANRCGQHFGLRVVRDAAIEPSPDMEFHLEVVSGPPRVTREHPLVTEDRIPVRIDREGA